MRGVWAIAACVLASLFALLGVWQLDRGEQKQAMIEAVARAESGESRTLDEETAIGAGRPLRIAARGRFEPESELLLDNQSEGGRAGVRVLTPFRADAGQLLLVDRGWLPVRPETRRPASVESPPAGVVSIRGLLTGLPGVGVRLGGSAIDPDARRPLLTYLDHAALRTFLGPRWVDGLLRMDADLAGGFLRNYSPVPAAMPPARHRGYAVQWFALSATVLATWLLLAFRRR